MNLEDWIEPYGVDKHGEETYETDNTPVAYNIPSYKIERLRQSYTNRIKYPVGSIVKAIRGKRDKIYTSEGEVVGTIYIIEQCTELTDDNKVIYYNRLWLKEHDDWFCETDITKLLEVGKYE
jgi:hypothetical protein